MPLGRSEKDQTDTISLRKGSIHCHWILLKFTSTDLGFYILPK